MVLDPLVPIRLRSHSRGRPTGAGEPLATRIRVVETVEQPLAKVRASINTASPECDVISLQPDRYFVLSKEGLLEKIDYDSVDKKTFADFPTHKGTPYGVGTFSHVE